MKGQHALSAATSRRSKQRDKQRMHNKVLEKRNGILSSNWFEFMIFMYKPVHNLRIVCSSCGCSGYGCSTQAYQQNLRGSNKFPAGNFPQCFFQPHHTPDHSQWTRNSITIYHLCLRLQRPTRPHWKTAPMPIPSSIAAL